MLSSGPRECLWAADDPDRKEEAVRVYIHSDLNNSESDFTAKHHGRSSAHTIQLKKFNIDKFLHVFHRTRHLNCTKCQRIKRNQRIIVVVMVIHVSHSLTDTLLRDRQKLQDEIMFSSLVSGLQDLKLFSLWFPSIDYQHGLIYMSLPVCCTLSWLVQTPTPEPSVRCVSIITSWETMWAVKTFNWSTHGALQQIVTADWTC